MNNAGNYMDKDGNPQKNRNNALGVNNLSSAICAAIGEGLNETSENGLTYAEMLIKIKTNEKMLKLKTIEEDYLKKIIMAAGDRDTMKQHLLEMIKFFEENVDYFGDNYESYENAKKFLQDL